MPARAKPRQTKQEVKTQLADLFNAVIDLVDAQSTTEQERLSSVLNFGFIGLDALGRVDERSLTEIRRRQKTVDALLGPRKQDSDEKWLRRQLEGLGKETAP